MIKKLDAETLMSSSPRDMAKKINELIEASNRQDRAIAYLLSGDTGYANARDGVLGKDAAEFYRDYFRNHVGKLNG